MDCFFPKAGSRNLPQAVVSLLFLELGTRALAK
jgi:hypothetical protein